MIARKKSLTIKVIRIDSIKQWRNNLSNNLWEAKSNIGQMFT